MTEQRSTLDVLDRVHHLVGRLKLANMDEMVEIIEELTAWNPTLKQHITTQKRLTNALVGDKYVFDKETNKVARVYEEKGE